MAVIDRFCRGVALVLDADRRLLGTITDGDLRRAILENLDLQTPVSDLLARKATSSFRVPVTAPLGTPPDQLLLLMQAHSVRQLPLLDGQARVAALVTMEELVPDSGLPLQAMIMAGGLGTRLRPLTDDTPKSMLPVGGRPLLEHIVEQLRQAGIRQVNVATHFKPEKITEHFGDGQSFGIDINYLNENQPLGTAGALSLLPAQKDTILVVNGDILTLVNYRAMLAFHVEHQASMTVAVRRFEMQVPYGVVECSGVQVRQLTEKPVVHYLVNAGIYLIEPSVLSDIPNGERLDMTDVIARLLQAGRTVVTFPIREYWLDIGQHMDYEQSQQDAGAGRLNS
jgi:dTDP-glucose pyrophosphorylase